MIPGSPDHVSALGLPAGDSLAAMHRNQVRRAPWPEFADFERERYPVGLREQAAVQWAGRAQAEYGSVHQFTQVAHALSEARVPLSILGALARLITDEVRHAELCAEMAEACAPGISAERHPAFGFPTPRAPWARTPFDQGEPALLAWAAEAILIACCLGETISRPMLEALAVVTTDPIPEGVSRQILRDEHLHATFGWETLAYLLPRLSEAGRAGLQERLRVALGGLEVSTACGFSPADVVGRELVLERGATNLGTLSDEQYAVIYYATMEGEILPKLQDLGFDVQDAWTRRHD